MEGAQPRPFRPGSDSSLAGSIPPFNSPVAPFPAKNAHAGGMEFEQMTTCSTQAEPGACECSEDVAMGKQGNVPFAGCRKRDRDSSFTSFLHVGGVFTLGASVRPD